MPAPLHRCLAVSAAATVAAALAAAWLLPVVLAPSARFDQALVRVCAAVAVLAVVWLWAAASITAIAAVRGRVDPSPGVPAPVRRAVLAACGVALSGGLVAGPAHATPGRPHEERSAAPTSVVSGLPVPDRALSTAEVVVVRPGDSLWSIARQRLGPDATDADVDAAWRELYALNRDVIGPDPDVVHPAQRLRMPISEVLP